MFADRAHLAFLAIGVWVSFLAFGWSLEALTKPSFPVGTGFSATTERWTFFNFLILVQCVGNALVGFVLLKSKGLPLSGGVASREFCIVGAAMLGAHKFGIGALAYVAYPVQVLVKSCKPVPVLVGEVVVANARHPLHKYISVCLLVLGVATFMLNRPDKSSSKSAVFEWNARTAWGLLLLLGALTCDGIYGPYQNRLKKRHSKTVTSFHLMFNVNLWEGIFASIFVVWNGEFGNALAFINRHPDVVPKLGYICLCMAIGSVFINKLQHAYGALTVTLTTTVRKLMTILLSVLWFGHDIAPVQWIGVCMVFLSGPVSKVIAKMIQGGAATRPKKD